ncbi:MAG: helix-turn-helix transcriptional regulator [Planctomycetota bacterium]|nr:helix-turn-helix transcriptional regulator [Planctomycetota bacterium]
MPKDAPHAASTSVEMAFDDLLGGAVDRIFTGRQASRQVPGFHTHAGEQVLVGLEGEATLELQRYPGTPQERRVSFAFREGDLAVLGPDKPHRWITPHGELIVLAINLPAQAAAPRKLEPYRLDLEVVAASLLGGGIPEHYAGLAKDDEEFKRLVAQYHQEARVRRPGVRMRVGALAVELLVHLARRCVATGPERQLDRGRAATIERLAPRHYVERARVIMHANYRAGQSLEGIAEQVGLSVTHLHRLFVAELGQPPMQYLRQYRLRRAAEWLAQTERPVGEIAQGVGFGSAERFSKAFREYFKQSPRHYRAEALKAGRALL